MIDVNELHAYADGELSPEARAQVDQAIASDPDTKARLESIVALKSLLAQKATPVENPELWSSCKARFAEIERSRRTDRFVTKYAWGLCATVAAALVLGRVYVTQNPASSGGGAADVARAFMGPRLDAQSEATVGQVSDRQLERWLADAREALDRKRLYIDAARWGRTPAGPRFEAILTDGVTEYRFVVICAPLDITRFPRLEGTPVRHSSINMTNVVVWSESGMTFCLGGEQTPEELAEVAKGIAVRNPR